MKIETLPTDKLIPYARNAKKHSDTQVASIAASIREFGFCNPVLIDKDDGIIAGHGRVLAAQKLALEKVPCIRLGHLTDNQRRAYILADNRLAETGGGWDTEMLKIELAEIEWPDLKEFSLDDLAIGEIEDIDIEPPETDTDAEPQIDKAAELNKVWQVKPGDLWRVGEHRLLCGDSTKAEDVAKVMDGEKADALISDPPYGMGFDASWYGGKTAFGTDVKSPTQHAGAVEWDAKPFDPKHLFGLSKTTALFGANFFCTRLPEDGTWWVWDKHITKDGETPTWYGIPFEMIWMNGKREHRVVRHLWAGFTRKATEQDKQRLHPTQKPVALMTELIEYLTEDEATVIEPYCGSGTTMVACENLGRKCRGIEISPDYCAVILQRMQEAFPKLKIEKV